MPPRLTTDDFRALWSDASVFLPTIGAIGLIFGGVALAPHLSEAMAGLLAFPVAGFIWYFLGKRPAHTATSAPIIAHKPVPTTALETTRLEPTRILELWESMLEDGAWHTERVAEYTDAAADRVARRLGAGTVVVSDLDVTR